MNMSFKSLGLTVSALALTTVAYGQKKNVTSAAVEFKNKFAPAMAKQDMESAGASILAAKGFIDLAAEHPDTKEDQKMMFYRGQIYASVAALEEASESFDAGMTTEEAMETALQSYKTGYTLGKKYQTDIEQQASMMGYQLALAADKEYNDGNYADAAEGYYYAYRFYDAIQKLDSSSLFNASLCYEQMKEYDKAAKGYETLAAAGYRGTKTSVMASRAYRLGGNQEKAMSIIDEARKANPTDRDLLLELVNANIDAGNSEGAEKALSDAIASDPENKSLHYTIGTIYIDLKQYENAEKSLIKALELDPNYVDAQYQLGAHLFNWSNDLKTEASMLKIGDPREKEMIAQSDEKRQGSIKYLEMFIGSFEATTDDDKAVLKAVLGILAESYYKSGDSEKYKEYKAKADAL